MKKYLSVLLIFCLICLFITSCAKNKIPQNNSDKSETQESTLANENADGDNTQPQKNTTADPTVDVDLTVLSGTMVYAEIYNIMTNPSDYMGKSIKMSGSYYVSYYDEIDRYYHYVVSEDAIACCQSGLEFIWNGGHTYPDDYPKEQTIIEVVGVFGSYEELGTTCYYLAVDDISVKE